MGGRLVLAVQRHDGMNVNLLVNYGDRLLSRASSSKAAPPALPKSADISRIAQQVTLVLK